MRLLRAMLEKGPACSAGPLREAYIAHSLHASQISRYSRIAV